jgi:hypothetical protein
MRCTFSSSIIAATVPSCCHEMPPWSPSELLVTAPSSAPTPGAPPTSLLASSAAPPLHHRRSSLAKPSHRRQPALAILRLSQSHPKHCTAKYILPDRSDPVGDPYFLLPPSLPCRRSPPPQRSLLMSSSLLFNHQNGPSPRRLAPRPLHRRLLDFADNSPVRTGEKTSPASASG